MSYCRWSSDDYQCDVYVWADVSGGWRTEVAGRRWEFSVDLPPTIEEMPVGEANSPERAAWAHAWVDREHAVMKLLDDELSGSWVDVPTPDGGHSYHHHTAAETADNLERLRGLGLNVPQYAIDALREEAHTHPERLRSLAHQEESA